MWVAFATFSAKILVYMPYLMIKSLNDISTNEIISFEQLGPDWYVKKGILKS